MKNTGDQGSRGATLVAPNKYSGEAVGLVCVCVMGIHNLLVIDSTLLVVFRDIVNHVRLGITIDLVRAVDHVFVEILGMIPQFLCGMLRLTPQTYHQT